MKFRRFNFKLGRGDGERPEVEKVNRVVYITAVCLLLGIIVLAAFTTAANRGRKPAESGDRTSASSTAETTAIKDVTTPSDTGVGEVVPILSLPVEGVLGKEHDPDMQVFSQTMGDYRVHTGIDILCAEVSPSNKYPGLISFRMGWLDLLAIQGTLKSLLQHHTSKHQFFGAQLSL